jgi:hypothetical protein
MNEPGAQPEGTPGVEPRNPAVAVAASVAVHALIALALVAMGITAARAMRREAPPVLVAEWTPPPPPGVAPAAPELPVPGGAPLHEGPAARARTDAAGAARSAADRLARLVPPAEAFDAPGGRLGGPLGFSGQLPETFRAASFATDRKRVAFVVDAGGRLLAAMPAARAVLAQRLAGLAPDQQFTVAVARGSGTELAPGTPAAATRANVAEALRWFTEQAKPGGTADLGAALERAWAAMEPDAVCLIARGTPVPRRTAARSATAALLPAADRLNPAGGDGRRPAAFLCIELVDPSADGAIRALGERHGGPTGYLLLDRAALGLAPARPVPSSMKRP